MAEGKVESRISMAASSRSRPAFGIAASEFGAPMHYIQSALGHGSVAVTERYYAKYDPKSAAKQLLQLIEGGKVKTGTWGE